MSAYICNTATFIALGQFASQRRHGSRNLYPGTFTRAINERGGASKCLPLIPSITICPIDQMTCLDHTVLVARILYDENVKSVAHRYPNDAPDELPGSTGTVPLFRSTNPHRAYPAITILKALDCLEYQSCEHPGWEDSLARFIVDQLRKAAIHNLPGYNDAPWGIE